MKSQEDFVRKIIKNEMGVATNALRPLSGGNISSVYKVSTQAGNYVIKIGFANYNLFEAEDKGLSILRNSNTVTVPEVICIGENEGYGYIIMEFIEPGRISTHFWKKFAVDLAHLHKTSSETYGLDFDNYIGSLPQANTPGNDWKEFFINKRLEPQLILARNTGKISDSIKADFEQLFVKLPELLISEPPALIHGDLWSGNFLINGRGEATLIDPSVYFGNREIEIAFTTLFGGFSPDFYTAYHEEFPLNPGFEERFDIYNLYPLLVHVNLFGTSYLGSIISILKKLV